jgi:hypothetical protein
VFAHAGCDPSFAGRQGATKFFNVIGARIFNSLDRGGQPVFELRVRQAIKKIAHLAVSCGAVFRGLGGGLATPVALGTLAERGQRRERERSSQ